MTWWCLAWSCWWTLPPHRCLFLLFHLQERRSASKSISWQSKVSLWLVEVYPRRSASKSISWQSKVSLWLVEVYPSTNWARQSMKSGRQTEWVIKLGPVVLKRHRTYGVVLVSKKKTWCAQQIVPQFDLPSKQIILQIVLIQQQPVLKSFCKSILSLCNSEYCTNCWSTAIRYAIDNSGWNW